MTSGDFDPNVRKWIVPIIGRSHPCQIEEDICTLIENMVYGAMELDGFGGVGLYALCYRIVKLTQDSNSSITENSEQLLSDGIIWECTLTETVDGVTTDVPGWAYLEANGAVLLKKDSSSGLAPWNDCATLLEGIAADLYGTTIHNHQIINGVIILKPQALRLTILAVMPPYHAPISMYTVTTPEFQAQQRFAQVMSYALVRQTKPQAAIL